MLDVFPQSLSMIEDEVRAAVKRGVKLFLQVYSPFRLKHVKVVLCSQHEEVLKHWRSEPLNLVVDGRETLVALLSHDVSHVHQAIRSNSLYLSCMMHAGFMREHTFHAIATWHPARLSLLGIRVLKGGLWIALTVGGALTGAVAPLSLLAFEAKGVPFVRELTLPEIVLTIWILSSVSEEFYCRGLVQPWIGDNADRVWTHAATIASAAVFGGMHLSLDSTEADHATVDIIVLTTTLWGYLCAVARRASGSLWPSILIHIGFNVGGFAGVVVILVGGQPIGPN